MLLPFSSARSLAVFPLLFFMLDFALLSSKNLTHFSLFPRAAKCNAVFPFLFFRLILALLRKSWFNTLSCPMNRNIDAFLEFFWTFEFFNSLKMVYLRLQQNASLNLRTYWLHWRSLDSQVAHLSPFHGLKIDNKEKLSHLVIFLSHLVRPSVGLIRL